MREILKLILCILNAVLLIGCTSSKNPSSQLEINNDFKLAYFYEEENKMKDIFLTNISENGSLSLWNMMGKIRITNLGIEDFEYNNSSLSLEFYKDGSWYSYSKKHYSSLEGLETFICRARESAELHFPSYDWFSLSPGHYRLVLTDPNIPEYEEPDPNETYYWTAIEFDLTNSLPENPKNSDEDLIPAFEREFSEQNGDIFLQISESVFAENPKPEIFITNNGDTDFSYKQENLHLEIQKNGIWYTCGLRCDRDETYTIPGDSADKLVLPESINDILTETGHYRIVLETPLILRNLDDPYARHTIDYSQEKFLWAAAEFDVK